MNSLQDFVDEVYVADSVLLEKDDAKGKTLLLVEGPDDEYIFKKLSCFASCKVAREDGDNNIIEAIKKHNKHNKKSILAIKDSHFDHIMARTLPPNVLTTDGHDVEVMILSTEALEDFVDSRVIGMDEDKVEGLKSALRVRLFELGALFGYLRFKSQQYALADKINVHTIMQLLDSSCEFTLNDVVNVLRDCSQDLDETIFSQEELEELSKHFLHDLCRGHDMVDILSKIFTPLCIFHLGEKVNPGRPLAEQLLAIFSRQHFNTTNLCRKIEAWQNDNHPHKVLSVH